MGYDLYRVRMKLKIRAHTHTVKLNPRNTAPSTHKRNAAKMKSANTCTGCHMGRQEGIRCCTQRFSGEGRRGVEGRRMKRAQRVGWGEGSERWSG